MFPPTCWRPFLRIALPVFAARGSATSQTGCATFRVIAVSPSSPSVPAVCAVEWRGTIADAVVETHDRIVGQTFRSAKRRCDVRIQNSRAVLHNTLDAFRTLGAALLEAKGDGAPLEEAVSRQPAAGGSSKALSLRLRS